MALLRFKTLLFSVACCLAGLSLGKSIGAVDSTATTEQIRQLEERIQVLQTQMLNTRTEYGRWQRQLQNNEEDIGMSAERLEMLNEELTDKKNTLADLKNQQETLRKQLTTQRRVLAQQIRSTYIIGRQDYLKLWLNQQDPFVIGRMLTYYDYFNRARTAQIESIKITLQRLKALQETIAQETEQLNQLVSVHANKKQQIELSYQERQTILDKLAKTLENQDKELHQLQEDKRQLEELLGTLGDALKEIPQPPSNLPEFADLRGQLAYPVQGKIYKQFGDYRIGSLKWQGLLINADLGSKVHAIASGRVAFAQWFRNLGQLVIIDHSKGYMSLYAHNQSLYTKVGDWVETGQVIASVGNSGGRTTPGLYFEIRQQGSPVNPLKWLKN